MIRLRAGKTLKALHNRFGLTQKEVAEEIDISVSNLSALENDKSNVGIVQRFAKHHNNKNANNNGHHSAMGVPNPNGTRMLFNSNWNNSSIISQQSANAWVVEVEQD